MSEWIPNNQMHPATNICGRRWKESNGTRHGVYYQFGDVPLDVRREDLLWGDIPPPPAKEPT